MGTSWGHHLDPMGILWVPHGVPMDIPWGGDMVAIWLTVATLSCFTDLAQAAACADGSDDSEDADCDGSSAVEARKLLSEREPRELLDFEFEIKITSAPTTLVPTSMPTSAPTTHVPTTIAPTQVTTSPGSGIALGP